MDEGGGVCAASFLSTGCFIADRVTTLLPKTGTHSMIVVLLVTVFLIWIVWRRFGTREG